MTKIRLKRRKYSKGGGNCSYNNRNSSQCRNQWRELSNRLLNSIKQYVDTTKAFNSYVYNRENDRERLREMSEKLSLYGDAVLEILNSDNSREIINDMNNIIDPALNKNGTYALLLYIIESGHTDMMELYPTILNPHVTDDMLMNIAIQIYLENEDINLAVRNDYIGNQNIENFTGFIQDMKNYPENFPNVFTYFDKKFPITHDFSRQDSARLVSLMNEYYVKNKKIADWDRAGIRNNRGKRYFEYELPFYKNTIISILNNPEFDLTLIDQKDKDDLVLDMVMSTLDTGNQEILNAYLNLTNLYLPDDIFAKIKEKSDTRENNQYDRLLLKGYRMKNLEKKLQPILVSNVAVAVRNLRNKNVFNGYNEDKTIKTVGVPDYPQANILGFLYGDQESVKKSNDEDEEENNEKKSFIKIQSSNPKQYDTLLSNTFKNINIKPSRENPQTENSSSSSSALGGRRSRKLKGRKLSGRKLRRTMRK